MTSSLIFLICIRIRIIFIAIAKHIRHCSRNGKCTISLNLRATQKGIIISFISEETKAQTDQATCLRFLPNRPYAHTSKPPWKHGQWLLVFIENDSSDL